jgi:hypothetical protein
VPDIFENSVLSEYFQNKFRIIPEEVFQEKLRRDLEDSK